MDIEYFEKFILVVDGREREEYPTYAEAMAEVKRRTEGEYNPEIEIWRKTLVCKVAVKYPD